jgi:hypothetical protein
MKEILTCELTHAEVSHQSTSADGKPSPECAGSSDGSYGTSFVEGSQNWPCKYNVFPIKNAVTVTLSSTGEVYLVAILTVIVS